MKRAPIISLLVLWLIPNFAAADRDCDDADLLAGLRPITLDATRGESASVTDGELPAEGTRWDGAGALQLTTATGAITYDLGRMRRVSAVFAQADANDVYVISGSSDGSQFVPLTTLANVVQSGHGLRARSSTFTEATLRYLRFSPSTGDGFYSVSELAAYCRAPAAFPGAHTAARADGFAREHSAALSFLPLGLSCLFAIGLVLQRRRGVRAAAVSVNASLAAHERNSEWVIHACFFGSGCAALIYEIVWFHLLRLVIGASALSLGLVLASFMGGMFLGSLLFARVVSAARTRANPLRVYGLLELAIGAFGLFMPLLLPPVRSLYVSSFGHGAASIMLRAAIAGGMLLPPTALMGATLPAIARRYGQSAQAGSRLASLYTVNTLGAVLGATVTGFWLLAEFDVWVATGVAVALNIVIGAAAIKRAKTAAFSVSDATTTTVRARSPRTRRAVQWATALSGLSALGAQVVWTRLLSLLFGATVYAFAIILAVFLTGLAAGGALATRWLRRGGDPVRALFACQCALLATLFAASWLLSEVLPYSAPSTLTPSDALHVLDSLRALDVILPSAVLWGASFPLALAAVSGSDPDAGRATGKLYAMNTAGAIAGALLTSYWTIPAFGTHLSAQLLVGCATLAAGVLLMAAEPALLPARGKLERWLQLALLATVGLFFAVRSPGLAPQFLAHGRHVWSIDPRDQYPLVSEGAAATVAVHIAPDGYRHFHVSGRVEASNNPDDLRLERLLGHLSALAHHEPRSVLVVGLGAGVTAGAFKLHPEVKRIVICEIEPRVTLATREFAHENYDILNDPRVELVFDDARHYLATTQDRFDVITSDPIHPWVRGNSVLFSRQYYAIVREHLNRGGIATQWVPLYDTSDEAIQIQLHTFGASFPSASVWNSSFTGGGYDVVLLGSADPIALDLPAMQARIDANPALQRSLTDVSLGTAEDLLATYGASSRDWAAWAEHAPINDDLSLRLEYSSGLALNQQHADDIYKALTAQATTPVGLFAGPEAQVNTLLERIAKRQTHRSH